MINVITLTNSTAQTILNAIKDMLDWYDVTMDGDNVASIDLSAKINIAYTNDTTITITDTNIAGSNTAQTHTITTSITTTIVQTDTSILITSGAQFIIGKTTDSNGNNSIGLACKTTGMSSVYVFTDDTTTKDYTLSHLANTSNQITQLIPIVDPSSGTVLDDGYLAFLSPNRSSDTGKIRLNDQYYYLGIYFAIHYTP